MTSVHITIIRGDDELEVEAKGIFYRGELETWSPSRGDLTETENDEIATKLIEARNWEWRDSQ